MQVQLAQPNLWGMTYAGGSGGGVIFKTDADGTNEQVVYDFMKNPGKNPYNSLTPWGTKLYGMTSEGGVNGKGVLFEYDPLTGVMTKKIDFNGASNGYFPMSSLIVFGNKLYGVTYYGGIYDAGTLFEYEPTTGVLTKKIDFDGGGNGGSPRSTLTIFGNKLYGITYAGGINDLGILFEYDPSNGVLTKKIDLDNTSGSLPNGSLTATGTKLYGLTPDGGTNGTGTLFEYDPSTGILTKKIDFIGLSNGSDPDGSLTLLGSKLYGMTAGGGINDLGTLFEYDTLSGNLTKKIDFNGPVNGNWPLGTLTLTLANNILYGMTSAGGTSDQGTLFEYDPSTGILVKKIDFDGTSNGSNPYGDLTLSGSKLYGMTYKGGTNSSGTLFEYDTSTATLTKKIDFSDAPNGINPYGSLTASGTQLYGMTSQGGANNLGTLFELDPLSGAFKKKMDFDSTNGSAPQGSLTAFGTKLYGMMNIGGANSLGTLFEYDPSAGTLTKKIDFNGLSNGSLPYGSLTALDTKLYGLTSQGGANDLGILFEYDTSTTTLTKKIEFLGISNGSYPYGSLIASNNKLYGMTSQGGANNQGTLFEYDPSTAVLTKKIDFDSTNGSVPQGSLTAFGTKLYGMTYVGGANYEGVLFEYDPAGNQLTPKISFDGTNGRFPHGSLRVSGTKLYGVTSSGGANDDAGTLFEYDPANGTLATKIDFNDVNGRTSYTQLLAYPEVLTAITLVAPNTDNISVFPNPSGRETFIYADDEAAFVKIAVTNLNGVTVYENDQVPTKEKFRLEGSFAQGIYFVNIICSKATVTKKMVKF